MKEIHNREDIELLKEGDWLCNKEVFRGVNEKNQIVGIQALWKIQHDGMLMVKSYTKIGDLIKLGGSLPSNDEVVYLVDKKEKEKIVKLLLLQNLETKEE